MWLQYLHPVKYVFYYSFFIAAEQSPSDIKRAQKDIPVIYDGFRLFIQSNQWEEMFS